MSHPATTGGLNPATKRAAFVTPVLLFLGSLLMQTAWIVALPPFRGTDEVDHAYRAAAVAGGQWRAGQPASNGRGSFVIVPRSLVTAARPVCTHFTYVGHDNCVPRSTLRGNRVLVASSAAAYNPLFYWVIGTVARPFDGAAALYTMRATAAVLCSLFIALAGWAAGRWRRTSWPLVAMVAAMTPVMLFSVSVAAPNGLEMCAALTVWLALLGLCRAGPEDRPTTPLLVTATAGAVVVCLLRSIGPLWVLLIVLTTLVPLGRRGVLTLIARNRWWVAACSTAVVAAAVVSVAWTTSAGTADLEPYPSDSSDRLATTLGQLPLWILQGMAAFPRRGDPAPGAVYVLVGFCLTALVVAGFRRAAGPLRLTMTVTLALAVAVPVVFTLLTVQVTGPIWQGRYGLPYAMGLVLVAGRALDATGSPLGVRRLAVALGGVGIGLANVVSVLHVQGREIRTGPLAHSPELLRAPAWTLTALVVCAFAAWAASIRAGGSDQVPRGAPSGRGQRRGGGRGGPLA